MKELKLYRVRHSDPELSFDSIWVSLEAALKQQRYLKSICPTESSQLFYSETIESGMLLWKVVREGEVL
jgi:hypothetical protein